MHVVTDHFGPMDLVGSMKNLFYEIKNPLFKEGGNR
jgi:hypothetical protein